MELTRIPGVIMFFALLFNCIPAVGTIVPPGQSITLAWYASPDTNVVGYNIYYGVASQTYSSMANVGNVTNATISGLVSGVTYYFAATAYDGFGDESDLSNETSYLVPNGLPAMQIQGMVAGQFTLIVQGQAGNTYDIMATQDFQAWTVIGTVTLGAGGSVNFTDTNTANFPQRFYRILDAQP